MLVAGNSESGMKFLLIGATGATDQEIVKQGLALGHEITALVRDASKVALSDPRLHLVAGDILKPLDVDAAMAGQDAVVCSVHGGRDSNSTSRCRSAGPSRSFAC